MWCVMTVMCITWLTLSRQFCLLLKFLINLIKVISCPWYLWWWAKFSLRSNHGKHHTPTCRRREDWDRGRDCCEDNSTQIPSRGHYLGQTGQEVKFLLLDWVARCRVSNASKTGIPGPGGQARAWDRLRTVRSLRARLQVWSVARSGPADWGLHGGGEASGAKIRGKTWCPPFV